MRLVERFSTELLRFRFGGADLSFRVTFLQDLPVSTLTKLPDFSPSFPFLVVVSSAFEGAPATRKKRQ
jgi:hypothetical protein